MGILDDVYGGSFLKAKDLVGDETHTISGWGTHKFDDGQQQVTLDFSDTDKKLGLNKTNAGMVMEMYGDDPDKWVGQDITLFKDKTSFQGGIVDCVRIRYIKAGTTPAALAPKAGPFGKKEAWAEFKRAFGSADPAPDFKKAHAEMDEGLSEWGESDWRKLADMAEGLTIPF